MVASKSNDKLDRVIVDHAAKTLTDVEVWRRIARPEADDADWEVAVARWAPLVHRVAHRVTGDSTTAEDVAQEAFIELVQAAKRNKLHANVPAWLCLVAARKAYKYSRKHRKLALATEVGVSSHPAREDAAIERADVAEVVRAEIANLPDSYRTAVVLCDLAELDHFDVARELNITRGNLDKRLYRARRALETLLRKRGVTAAASAAVFAVPSADAADSSVVSRLTAALHAETSRLAAGGLPAAGWAMSVKCKVAVAAVAIAGIAAVALNGSRQPAVPAEPRSEVRPAPGEGAEQPVELKAFEVSVWRPAANRGDNRFIGRVRKGGSTVVPQRGDLFAWDVTLDAPHPCRLLHVRPDGSVRDLNPTGEGEVPEPRTTFRYPATEKHDGVSHTLDDAGNQALVLVVQRRPAADPVPNAVPWQATTGEGLWYADPDGGVREVELLNRLALKPFNPDTRDPVEEVVKHLAGRRNVRAVFAFGLPVRP